MNAFQTPHQFSGTTSTVLSDTDHYDNGFFKPINYSQITSISNTGLGTGLNSGLNSGQVVSSGFITGSQQTVPQSVFDQPFRQLFDQTFGQRVVSNGGQFTNNDRNYYSTVNSVPALTSGGVISSTQQFSPHFSYDNQNIGQQFIESKT